MVFGQGEYRIVRWAGETNIGLWTGEPMTTGGGPIVVVWWLGGQGTNGSLGLWLDGQGGRGPINSLGAGR